MGLVGQTIGGWSTPVSRVLRVELNRRLHPSTTTGLGLAIFQLTTRCKMSSHSNDLNAYQPPDWVNGKLNYQPKYRVKLANLPTSIHPWSLPGLPDDITLAIKRDDTTEATLSGNKLRKLEFILADAISKGCKHVAACGGLQSNFLRATALAAVRFGLTPHLFIRCDIQGPDDVGCQGNLLLYRLSGAKMYIMPKVSQYETDIKPRMDKLASKIKETTGEATYIIPLGGSNQLGAYGYMQAFEELKSQGVLEQYDDIVVACGSGGTTEGLALGNCLTGSKLKVHGIVVSDSSEYFRERVDGLLQSWGMTDIPGDPILDLIDGYKGRGYGLSTQQELDFIVDVAVRTGIILEPVYTGKAAYGLVQELKKSPQRFQGRRILFVHTGGIFGMYNGCMEDTLTQKGSVTNQIAMWPNVEDDAPVLTLSCP